ncbi:hypothetical protein PF001_g24507 [Phytophthora fragariae]|uniref:Integrase catalytic domain-containing protein n=1 Tax=Phytophthora fragariae TaxID=53985 RepID=A0A6A4BSQ8_9STRA|nr:hypothetical protein PF001_g24507 [Phytophthora fragariae]
MGPMQTKTPGGCTYAVTFIDDFSRHVTVYFMKKKAEVLEKFKMFKADMENATGRKIKRLRSDNGGEYTGRLFKEYLSKQGIRHEKTVPYTPQQNGLAERMNRSLVEMARCMLYHEGIDKKWWAEAVNTSAWIINRIPNTVTVKTPYEIVYQKKPQLQNLKVFGALGYGHIPDEKRRKLYAKAFKCRYLGYEDGVKGCRVLNMETGQVRIVRTVKFMETTSTGDFVTEVEGDDKDGDEDVAAPHATAPSRGQTQTLTIFNDEVVPLQHEVTTETAIVPASSHSIITRSRTRHIKETTDPEEAEGRKKQIVAPSAIGTDRQKVSQARVKPTEELLAIEGGQLMAATEEVPKTYAEATTRQGQDEWKKAIASELESLIANKTWKLVPKPAHQRPIGCRWVFALKRDEKGQVVRYKARLVAKGYSQRHGIDYEETYSPFAYLNSVRAMLAKCGAEGMEIEQCDVDAAFLYGKLEEEIYMELPEGLKELLDLAEAEGKDDVVCMLLQILYGHCGAPVVWRSMFQKTVALSSTEAEYMALSDCVKECVWMRRLLKDIGAEQVGHTVIYEDNQGAMALAKNVGYQARTKHIDIRYHFIREKVVSNEVELEYVDTKNQLADFMTKSLSSKTLRYSMMQSNAGPKLETSN